MLKRILFTIMLTVAICSIGLAGMPRDLVKFNATEYFLLDAESEMALPAGEYIIRDMGIAPQRLLSVETKERQFVAFLNTVPIYRASIKKKLSQDAPEFIWDSETTVYPVMKKFYLPGGDGYEILGAVYNEKSAVFDYTFFQPYQKKFVRN